MAIYELDGMAPKLAEGAWVADSAEVIGQVEMAENAAKEPVFNAPAYNQTIFNYKRRFEGGYRERTFARTMYHHNMARWREGLPSL